MLCLIDNYDSFTYNIAAYLHQLSVEPRIIKNDEYQIDTFKTLGSRGILISPGPGTPDESGISLDIIRHFSYQCPILGICLGHEAIAHVFGGHIKPSNRIMHGKTSRIYHDGQGIFMGVPNPVRVARYHSLAVEKNSLPKSLYVSAWTIDESGNMDEIMGIRHREFDVEGIQFHPESILTEYGHLMLANFVNKFSTRSFI